MAHSGHPRFHFDHHRISGYRGNAMKKGMMACLVRVGGVFATALRADVLVLIHGYLSSAQSWDASGITTVLDHAG
jgi:hypothetical protein